MMRLRAASVAALLCHVAAIWPTGMAPAAPAPGDIAPPSQGPVVVAPRLRGALPPTGPIAARRGVRKSIVVQFTVEADGTTSHIEVVQGHGQPWDGAAIRRIQGARFDPGTQDGVPTPFRLTSAVPVGTVSRHNALGRRASEPTPVVPAGISGIVVERGTRTPLAGVPIILDGDDSLTVTTDSDGRFAFINLAKGKHTLDIPSFEHKGLSKTVTAPAKLTLRLTPSPTRSYRTVVRPATADAARVTIPVERARDVPGSAGDPIKVIESLPGLARPAGTGPGAGQLAVRGSAPEDTSFYVDGMPLFQLYHFGNLYSVLQDEWIKDVDFRAGGVSDGVRRRHRRAARRDPGRHQARRLSRASSTSTPTTPRLLVNDAGGRRLGRGRGLPAQLHRRHLDGGDSLRTPASASRRRPATTITRCGRTTAPSASG